MADKGKPESTVQKECLLVLSRFGVFHWRQNSGAVQTHGHFYRMTSIKGVSDILGILPDGRFLAVEVKRQKGGRVSPDQKDFIRNIQENNGIALVINDSKELEEKMKELLKR